MGIGASLAIYSIVWWVVLFTVLPLGAVSHAEAGIPTPGGGDPAAPVNPRLVRKFLITTVVSLVIFAPFWIAVKLHWLTLGMFRGHG